MDEIYYKKILVGIRVRTLKKGSVPITRDEEPLQLLGLKHPKGHYFVPHRHTPMKRVSNQLQECLVVRKGKVKVDIYAPGDIKFKSVILKEGELFILLNGGYGIHVLEDAELFELKNGPFLGNDKVLI
ncbi:MAG: hypothetical protein G01um101429_435 [Parcubacteria group bacterium Gr01-1014_29]|nr:MAG: hypothetical protein G01um101429_435 [Parcubacteria group bacterium Gr01-1014_29]